MSESKPPHLWIRIIMPEGGAIGPGKIDLLRAINDEQSISAAARSLDMSYRRAWMLLDETRRAIGAEVIETHAGGADKGGAVLTQAGRDLISAYERVCTKAATAADADLRALTSGGGKALKPAKPAKPAKRKAKAN